MKRKKHVLTIEDAMSIATMDLSGLYDIMDRPRILFATAVARLAKSDEEAITALLYVAMSRGRFMEDVVDKTIMPASVKDALRQLSDPGLDITTDVFNYQIKQILPDVNSPSQTNRDGAEMAKATLCHSVALEERQMMADINALMGDTVYYGSREETLAEMDAGSRLIVEGLTKKLVEVVWQKSRLIREFGVQWFVEGGLT